jgi:hypothetical protein
MISIIKNAASLGITYTASSLSQYSDRKSENVFEDNDVSLFDSLGNAPNQWWQVSFSKQVAISSYIIRTNNNYGNHPVSWHIDASDDGVSWKTVHTVTGTDVGGNTARFYPSTTINCVHFRIILDQNSSNGYVLAFTFFDCFGGLNTTQTNKVKCYCTGNNQCLLISQTFILSLINIVTLNPFKKTV